MVMGMRLIDADRLLRDPYFQEDRWPCSHLIRMAIGEQRTVDAIPKGAHDQVRWERDTAIQQLEEHGIPFGGIAPDVVKVVRCKDCKHFYHSITSDRDGRCVQFGTYDTDPSVYGDDFCSYGERKDNEKL
jgi:hypothetical protein